MATPVQAVFGRDMLFNLMSVVDWQVVTAASQRQVDIDNVRENARWVTHDYVIGNLVYVEMTGIYCKLDYKKQVPYVVVVVVFLDTGPWGVSKLWSGYVPTLDRYPTGPRLCC